MKAPRGRTRKPTAKVAMLSSTPTPAGSSGGKKSTLKTSAAAVPYTAKS